MEEQYEKVIPVFTGISNILTESFETLIFTDNTCPKCGEHSLEVESKKDYEDKNVMIRYVCGNCGYICPISREHVTVGEEAEYRPGYDHSIRNFMKIYHEKKGDEEESYE